jgi:hypothetical protein
MSERSDYELLIERARKMRRGIWEYMDVIPVHFSIEHKDMLAHCKIKLEKELVAINPRGIPITTHYYSYNNKSSF